MSRSLSSHQPHPPPQSQDSSMTPPNESATAASPLAITLRNRVLSPPLGFNPPNTSPTLYTSAVAHFLSIPWCACLIQTPNTVPFVPQCFNPFSPSHDQLLGATLATPRGVQQVLSFFHTEDETHVQDPSRPIMHVSTLFALGEGLCGYEGVLHGGMIMTMADESMGVLHDINNALGKVGSTFGSANVTANLEISFLKPGPINETVLVNAWVDSVEGRRTRIKCEIRDGRGIEIAKCSSTWVSVRPKM
ncbi:HotDog domain-containing protein [Trichoderma austrokoningii]